MKAVLFALVAALAFAPTADATHFRYGSMRWTYTQEQPSDRNLYTIELQMEFAMRYGWPAQFGFPEPNAAGVIINFDSTGSEAGQYEVFWGDGKASEMSGVEVTVSDPTNDVFLAVFTEQKTFKKGGSYDVYYGGCCRLANIGNNAGIPGEPNGPWFMLITVEDDTDGQRSPVASWLPIVEVGDTGMQYIQMIALPPTADSVLEWGLASNARMGGVQPSATDGTDLKIYPEDGNQFDPDPLHYGIDKESGLIWFNADYLAAKGGSEGLFTTQIITGGSLSPQITVPVDFFIRVVSQNQPLCVSTCSNAGTECSLEDMSPCAGDCVGQTYDACQGNILPEVETETLINQFTGTEVAFTVRFVANTLYENYQNLTMSSSSLPAGASFVYTPAPTDGGFGTFVLSAAETSVPKQFISCFAAYDDYNWGPPVCTKVNLISPRAGPNWWCHKLNHQQCLSNSTCTWDKPWRVCRGVEEYADFYESYQGGTDMQRYIGDPCRWYDSREHDCKKTSMCEYNRLDSNDGAPDQRMNFRRCAFRSVTERSSKRGRESWTYKAVEGLYHMNPAMDDMLCGEAFTQHDCQNLNENEYHQNREQRCLWEKTYVIGVGYPYCRPIDQTRINVNHVDHPDDYREWAEQHSHDGPREEGTNQHISHIMHYPSK